MISKASVKKWTAAHRRITVVSALALAHFIFCWGAFVFTYKDTMARFETGRLPNQFEASVQSLFDTLSFPFLQLAGRGPAPFFQAWYGIVPMLLTSILWGSAVYFGFLGTRRTAFYVKRRSNRRVMAGNI